MSFFGGVEGVSRSELLAGSDTGAVPPATYSAPSSVSPHWAIATAVFSQMTQAYAQFSAVRSAQETRKSQASALGHRARMLQLDQRWALRRAESVLHQGQRQAGQASLVGAQRRAQREVVAAAAGVDSGVGSAAEVQVSEQLVEDIEVYDITLASVRQANAARQGAQVIENERRSALTTGRGLRSAANAAAPEASLLGGLGSSVARASALYNYRRR